MPTIRKRTGKTIEDAYSEALARYAHRDNVTGIDIGYKYKDGQATDVLAIRLHVKEKLPKSALEAAELFPDEIEGFPVDVIQGNYQPDARRGPGTQAPHRATRFSRLQPGISVAHTSVTAGTLGMFVRDRRSGRPAILSNWHVLAGSASAAPGDAIVQPGPHDGGQAPRDTVGALERMMLDKDGDAAIAAVNDARPFDPSILDLAVVPDSLADPQIGDEVVKSGRTTQVTRGRVDGKGRYFITYPVGRVGIDGFIIVPRAQGNPTDEEISMSGDSGAVWIKDGTGIAVGLHFAGETDPRPSQEHAIACFATRVFARLDIEPWIGTARIEAMKPRIKVITLGVDDLERSLRFYRDGLGLQTEGIIGTEFEHGAVVFFDLEGGLKLALYPRKSLAHDATVPLGPASATEFSMGHNVGSKKAVDAVMDRARKCGATLVKPAQDTFWGGYGGYFQDPDGHLWEVVWNPQWAVDDEEA